MTPTTVPADVFEYAVELARRLEVRDERRPIKTDDDQAMAQEELAAVKSIIDFTEKRYGAAFADRLAIRFERVAPGEAVRTTVSLRPVGAPLSVVTARLKLDRAMRDNGHV